MTQGMAHARRESGPEFMDLYVACKALVEEAEAGKREADPELVAVARQVVESYPRFRRTVAEATGAITARSLGLVPMTQAEEDEAAAVAAFDQARAELFDLAGQIADVGRRAA